VSVSAPTIVDILRHGLLDAELAGLLWLFAANRVPIHVVPGTASALRVALAELSADPAVVTDGPGTSIEEVLRQPLPLRPATGAIVVTDERGRVVAAHLLRPPLRDGAGHVRPQAPGVLAARVEADDRLEHFAWGVMPEIAAELEAQSGDLEADVADRAAFLWALATTGRADPDATRNALRSWHRRASRSQ
jgi:hypothetical protein